ncbi:hypothetical protein EJB05_14062, partial [Eragrostis curvula]
MAEAGQDVWRAAVVTCIGYSNICGALVRNSIKEHEKPVSAILPDLLVPFLHFFVLGADSDLGYSLAFSLLFSPIYELFQLSYNDQSVHWDAILLVVIPAMQAADVVSSLALRLAKNVNSDCLTVGVISKVDQVSGDAELPLVDIMNGIGRSLCFPLKKDHYAPRDLLDEEDRRLPKGSPQDRKAELEQELSKQS